jgi:hypothetical protein
MNKVENQKVDDSAHLSHASSTLDKSRTIPVDGKWHCVKSESKNRNVKFTKNPKDN